MNQVLISVGSNVEDPMNYVKSAINQLGETFDTLRSSSLYETQPVGIESTENFINATVLLETELLAHDLLELLLEIERAAGRERVPDRIYTSRQLDLDIILYGDKIMDDHIKIPHPRFRYRRFVLEPAAEIAPQMYDPVSGMTISELLDVCIDGNWVKKVETRV